MTRLPPRFPPALGSTYPQGQPVPCVAPPPMTFSWMPAREVAPGVWETVILGGPVPWCRACLLLGFRTGSVSSPDPNAFFPVIFPWCRAWMGCLRTGAQLYSRGSNSSLFTALFCRSQAGTSPPTLGLRFSLPLPVPCCAGWGACCSSACCLSFCMAVL